MKKRVILKMMKYTFFEYQDYKGFILLAYHLPKVNLKYIMNFRMGSFKNLKNYSKYYRLRKENKLQN